MNKKQWFEEWFDSAYYHRLYSNRNDTEAATFTTRLSHYLNLKEHSKILDFACGKGRHSINLNNLKMNVIGVDLSSESIYYAKKFENNFLKFYKHDIRHIAWVNYFDVVLSLFTSFGYFSHPHEDLKVLKNCYVALKKNGYFVLDFFNAQTTVQNLILEEIVVRDGLQFNIGRALEHGFITKTIDFEDNGALYSFKEKVRCLYPETILDYLEKTKFEVIKIWGSYQLDDFEPYSSKRIIILVKKS